MLKKISGFLLSEVSGKVFISVGIVCEIIYKAPTYLILVTVGSLLISVGAELRLHKREVK